MSNSDPKREFTETASLTDASQDSDTGREKAGKANTDHGESTHAIGSPSEKIVARQDSGLDLDHASSMTGDSKRIASYATDPQAYLRRAASQPAYSVEQSALLQNDLSAWPGEEIAALERYEDVRKVGEGSFGTVFSATDSILKRRVAVKVLKSTLSAVFIERFKGEAQRLAMMDHPGICKIFDFSATPHASYLVTEWLPGESLADLEMPIDPTRACHLIAEVADALAYAHRHEIIHRDLKPANIMLDGNGHVRVIDFGLSAGEQELTSDESSFGGSPAYMAPEQTTGRLHILDGRVDIWALGIILYELITGKRPFRGQSSGDLLSKIREKPAVSPRTFSSSVPTELEQVILKCLAKRPTDRFATASDLAKELRKIGTANSLPAASVGINPTVVPNQNVATWRRKLAMVAIGLLLAVTSLSSALYFLGNRALSTTSVLNQPMKNSSIPVLPKPVRFEVIGSRPSTGQTWTIGSENLQSPDIHVDDVISLSVSLPSPRHVYLIWLGADTGITSLYPGPIGSTREIGNPRVDRPIDNLLLNIGQITETPSTETVIMIATDTPFSGSAQMVEMLTQLPRPEVNAFVPPGTIRGMHFNSDAWDDSASTPILMRESYRPLAEFLQSRFDGRASVQAVSFVSGDI